MSQEIMDLAHGTVMAVDLPPLSRAADGDGAGTDMQQAAGPVNAILSAGTIAGTGTAAIKMQECDTVGGSYTDISGAAFTTLQAPAASALQAIMCQPTKRFVRTNLDVTGAATFVGQVMLIAQDKTGGSSGVDRSPST